MKIEKRTFTSDLSRVYPINKHFWRKNRLNLFTGKGYSRKKVVCNPAMDCCNPAMDCCNPAMSHF